MPVVSVSMPEAFVDRLDEYVTAHGYDSRSEVVRQGTQAVLAAEADGRSECEPAACIVTARLQGREGNERPLADIRHRYDDLVMTCVHSHPSGSCLEVFVIEGTPDELDSFVSQLRAVNGVADVSHMRIPDPQPLLGTGRDG